MTHVSEVVVGRGLPEPLLPVRDTRQRVAVLSQPSVAKTVEAVVTSLERTGLEVLVLTVSDRDEAKTLRQAEVIYTSLAEFELGRQDTVLGIGGGAVTDLAGFIAATWLRGIEAVYVSTTLLGAVDASLGGKTGLNLAGKNLVGSFWNPTKVIVDIDTIEALPPRLISEGMAEAYKTGLVGDPMLATIIENDALGSDLESVVTKSMAVKLDVVSEDPLEGGRRAILNFGHTIGHAIEFASDLSHGECVGIGMIAESKMSEDLVDFQHSNTVATTIQRLGLPHVAPSLKVDEVLRLIRLDKKVDSGGIRMVLLEEVGRPVIRHVSEADLVAGLQAIGLRSG